MTLPTEYISYFAGNGLREGSLAFDPGWFRLWSPAEIEQRNREYQVTEFAPKFLAFGSNGGGELLAFNTAGHIVMLPMIGMSPDEAMVVANSWADFVGGIES